MELLCLNCQKIQMVFKYCVLMDQVQHVSANILTCYSCGDLIDSPTSSFPDPSKARCIKCSLEASEKGCLPRQSDDLLLRQSINSLTFCEPLPGEETFCKEHPGAEKAYCLDCKEELCSFCMLKTNHKHHECTDFKELESIVEKKRELLLQSSLDGPRKTAWQEVEKRLQAMVGTILKELFEKCASKEALWSSAPWEERVKAMQPLGLFKGLLAPIGESRKNLDNEQTAKQYLKCKGELEKELELIQEGANEAFYDSFCQAKKLLREKFSQQVDEILEPIKVSCQKKESLNEVNNAQKTFSESTPHEKIGIIPKPLVSNSANANKQPLKSDKSSFLLGVLENQSQISQDLENQSQKQKLKFPMLLEANPEEPTANFCLAVPGQNSSNSAFQNSTSTYMGSNSTPKNTGFKKLGEIVNKNAASYLSKTKDNRKRSSSPNTRPLTSAMKSSMKENFPLPSNQSTNLSQTLSQKAQNQKLQNTSLRKAPRASSKSFTTTPSSSQQESRRTLPKPRASLASRAQPTPNQKPRPRSPHSHNNPTNQHNPPNTTSSLTSLYTSLTPHTVPSSFLPLYAQTQSLNPSSPTLTLSNQCLTDQALAVLLFGLQTHLNKPLHLLDLSKNRLSDLGLGLMLVAEKKGPLFAVKVRLTGNEGVSKGALAIFREASNMGVIG